MFTIHSLNIVTEFMRIKHLLVALLLIVIQYRVNAQSLEFKPLFSIVLNKFDAHKRFVQCSRYVPKNIKNYWYPMQEDILLLENNFGNINSIIATECCLLSKKVQSMENFGFQYIGVVIKGKKFVYVNAFPIRDVELYSELHTDLTVNLIVVCDGGSNYWGALFDPSTKQFSALSFNGM
ncbi:hypothetical protein [Hymenobacter perfusus]|uniref:Uncharacterized protein n=1 Tax=Hymenobacter perfusus TaxID=1236770 RepID=A0A428K7W9_9BACT|nr:hypothetical protein [Hymenobacter perfusus]RSK42473.1 hypothetical protein EI293_16305 [Hymenobacter perfusus]